MQIQHCRQTIEVDVSFTGSEKLVLEHIRTAPHGIYWRRSLTNGPLTLDELRMLQDTLEVCLGYNGTHSNMFKPGDDETLEDVPYEGQLTEPAEALLDDLRKFLNRWESSIKS